MAGRFTAVLAALVCACLAACGAYVDQFTLSATLRPSSIAAYGTSQVTVIQSIYGGSDINVTSTASLSSSAPGVAKIDSKGRITASGIGGTTTITARYEGQTAKALLTVAPATAVDSWGDELTLGSGASDAAHSYPGQLATLLQRTVNNYGIAAQASTPIAARQGGVTVHLSLQNNDSPASGPANVTAIDVPFLSTNSERNTHNAAGALGGFHGTVTRTARPSAAGNVESYSFTQDAGAVEQTIPAQSVFTIDAALAAQSAINIFWSGRYNYSQMSQVLADVAAMVGYQTSGKFVVLSVLNGAGEGRGTSAYNQITALNSALQKAYPNNYLDVRAALVAAYDPANAQDVQDQTNDIPPASLRAGSLNPNNAGYAVVAAQLQKKVMQEGW
jgi:hypothetical protein